LYKFLLCFNEKIMFCSLYCAVCWPFLLDLSLLVSQRLASHRLEFSCWPLLWRPSFSSSCPDFFCSLSLQSSFSDVSSHHRSVRCSQRFLVWQAIHCFPWQQSTPSRIPSMLDSVFVRLPESVFVLHCFHRKNWSCIPLFFRQERLVRSVFSCARSVCLCRL
jgi:hypothetical protein